MIEVNIEQQDFLKIKETLTRMGIANNKEKVLYQSCHILQKNGKYYIVHFKEMFAFDGKGSIELSSEDEDRTDSIAKMLESWDLLEIVEPTDKPVKNLYRILSHRDSKEWKLVPKYNVGNKG